MAHRYGPQSEATIPPPPPASDRAHSLRGGASGGRRVRAVWSLLAVVGLAATVVVLAPGSATGQGTFPSTPSGVTVTAGDVEAMISWSAGGTGSGGSCASSEYYVTVYDASQQEFPAVAESLPITGATSWYVEELRPATMHYVEVEAYGSACGEYSEDLGTTIFWTNASSSGSDPTAPGTRKKRVPAPIRGLKVNGSTITWKKPADIGTKRNVRCPYTHQASDSHANLSIEYNLLVENLNTGVDVTDEHFTSADTNLSRTVNLPLGIGFQYRVTVTAYSEVCGDWSASRHHTWWS